MNIAKDFVIPTAILTLICVAAAGALVWVHSFTQPIIDDRDERERSGAMRVVLEAADTFTLVETDQMPAGVTAINKANNGAGAAVAVESKGYSSTLVQLMVGIKSDGTIEKIQVVKAEETPGIGTKALADDYLAKYIGKSSSDYEGVDSVAGATITTMAVKGGVKSAFNGYAVATGGTVAEEPEKGLTQALIAQYYPGITPEPVTVSEPGAEAFVCGDAGHIVIHSAKGFGGDLKVAVLFDADGAILWSVVTETNETRGIGDRVEKDEFTQLFVGKHNAEGVDTIVYATVSSTAYKQAVDNAAKLLETIKGA